ncbi:TetR/AcrR family transcriptional regulator [Actinoplanes couchii]|uniref:HTH tetR-type domain-containing protein n=1 Tax=Actinoplanes couchii TaxID=403638 RepID=A0ABQ3X4A4_9ACTN|nr:TetR family transcriptional regulator [Actinoplanes couchii]MDR6326313.1 AcrR family transcriptional regulator [Actinoplanes couchii]GID53334.1 hypothetical protein Aco03nite_017380 [Actinoplanes couchii]
MAEKRLTEDVIFRTALRLVDADGVEALSMRKLAAELGVNPMSIYHHVDNKAALLDGITRMVTAEVKDITVSDGPWPDQLRRLAYEFRALTLTHRHLLRYILASDDFTQRDGPMWRTLRTVLRSAGIAEAELNQTAMVLVMLIGGLLHTEAEGAEHRDDSTFALAVELLIDGIAART